MRSRPLIRSARWLLVVIGTGLGLASCAGPSKPAAAREEATGSYAFWPQFPDEPRIQFVRAFSGSEDLASTKRSGLERIVFGPEAEVQAFINKPYGVAMRGGRIYVCDMRGAALTVLDLKANQTRLVGTTGVNRLNHPVDVEVTPDGMIYVADNERGAVLVYDARERYAFMIGFPKFKPVSLASHGDRLYVADMTAQAVQVFDRRSGERLGSIGTVGDEDGQFRLPLGVATDRAGNLYVVDMMRCRVQKFSPEGRFLGGFGALGDYAGTFARPKHIDVDSEGVIYVVDSAFQNVQMFDDQFRLLMSFGAAGEFLGALNLPAGICVSDDEVGLESSRIHPGLEPRRFVAVTSQFGVEKVSLYARADLRPQYTAADLARSAATVSAGVGEISEERRRLQEQGTQPEPIDNVPPAPATPPAAPPGSPQKP